MKTKLFDTNGKKLKDITLPKEVFDVKPNLDLIAQAIRVFNSNQHQSSSKALTRGEVKRTTAKVWRQKGTGNARHGSKKAPIFVGGGVAHGPKKDIKPKLKLTKKMKKIAITSALSTKSDSVVVVEKLDSIKPKTKLAQKLLQKIVDYKHLHKDRVLIIIPNNQKNTLLAFRNLPGVDITQAKRINVYEIVKSKQIIIDNDSLEVLTKIFAQK